MNFPLPNWFERKELSPSTQLQPNLQIALHQAARLHASNNSSNPHVLGGTPREQKVKFNTQPLCRVTGESLDCNAENSLLFSQLPAPWNGTLPSPASPAIHPALPVLQHQDFPCPNAHFVGTTPLFIFQLPIIWTSYYLVNNSTSLTSFIINFFF